MITNIDYVSYHAALADFYEDNKIVQTDANESLIQKWTLDKIEDFTKVIPTTPSIAWLSVDNYKADKPIGFTNILEVGYRIKPKKTSCKDKGYQIVQYVQDTHQGCELELNVVCPDCHKSDCNCQSEDIIVDINEAWKISHPEIFYEKYVKVGRFGYGHSIYDPGWKILTYTSNDFFGLNKHIPGCSNIYCKECPHTYRLNGPTIETSFEKGELLVSYMNALRDENGDLMIPKHRKVFEAILEWNTYKWYRRESLNSGDAKDERASEKAYIRSRNATVEALAKLKVPSFEEFSKFWSKNKWSKMDTAYENLLKGNAPIVNIDESRNIYKS